MNDSTSLLDLREIANGYTYTILAAISLSLVNFLGLKIYNVVTGKKLSFIWRDKTITLDQIINRKTTKQMISRVRILLIDNEESINIQLFKDEGYTIEYWDKVKSMKPLFGGKFEIIILDIRDVAKDLSSEDGFGVLKAIKDNNPSQVIIAYSAYSYDLSKKRFWDLADEAVDKPSGFLEMKKVLDDVIQKYFNPDRILQLIRARFKDINISNKNELQFEKAIVRDLKSGVDVDLDSKLSYIQHDPDKVQIKNMVISFLNLFTNYEIT